MPASSHPRPWRSEKKAGGKAWARAVWENHRADASFNAPVISPDEEETVWKLPTVMARSSNVLIFYNKIVRRFHFWAENNRYIVISPYNTEGMYLRQQTGDQPSVSA